MWSSAAISSSRAPGGANDMAFTAVFQELTGPVLGRGDDRQSARQGFQNHERARVVVAGLHEEVAGPVAFLNVGIITEKMNGFSQPQAASHAPVRRGITPAANQQVNGPGRVVATAAQGQRLEQRLEPFECKVMAGEEPQEVPGLESQPVPQRAAKGARMRDFQPPGIDRIGNDKDPVRRHAVKMFQMPFDHVADGDHPPLVPGIILPALDQPVHPVLGVCPLGGEIQRLDQGRESLALAARLPGWTPP